VLSDLEEKRVRAWLEKQGERNKIKVNFGKRNPKILKWNEQWGSVQWW